MLLKLIKKQQTCILQMNHQRNYKVKRKKKKKTYISIIYSLANKCLLKVAQISADLEDYPTAIEKYEQVAAASADDPLLKWSLKEYFLKAGLCHLCTDVSIFSFKRERSLRSVIRIQ